MAKTLYAPSQPSTSAGAGRVILIRHPQTKANATHLIQGSTESPLTCLGVRQLRILAEAMAIWSATDIPRLIVHSPLGRCERLARGVAGEITHKRERSYDRLEAAKFPSGSRHNREARPPQGTP